MAIFILTKKLLMYLIIYIYLNLYLSIVVYFKITKNSLQRAYIIDQIHILMSLFSFYLIFQIACMMKICYWPITAQKNIISPQL